MKYNNIRKVCVDYCTRRSIMDEASDVITKALAINTIIYCHAPRL